MLVKVDTSANSNKFYEVILDEANSTVRTRWGRVGADGQRKTLRGGRDLYNRTIASKRSRGYSPVDVVAAGSKASRTDEVRRASHAGLAAKGSESDVRLTALIDHLVAKNAHEILSTSGGQIKVVNGQVTTPVGLLSELAIAQARAVLTRIESTSAPADRVRLLEQYLAMVPQKVGARGGWHEAFLTDAALLAQHRFLDQLASSVQFAAKQSTADGDDQVPAGLFRMRMSIMEDTDPRFAEITDRYTETANANHGAVATMRLKRVYILHDEASRFDEARSVGNVRWMWHGTRAFNVLSILSKGLFCPPATASNVTGRMFGNGLYLSEQSTKSLNYARGVWDARGYDNRCFMMLAEVAMGVEYRPTSSTGNDWSGVHSGQVRHPRYGRYDSVNLKAGTCNVRNHEAVVWNADQIALRYLCEFES